MKKDMSSLDMEYMIRDLAILKKSRIDKIFTFSKKDVLFQVYKAELGKPILRLNVPHLFYMTRHKAEFGHPSNFCMALRKRLKNGIITGLSKMGNERIIKLTIEKKEEDGFIRKYHLYFEFFMKGNVILVDDYGDIQLVAEPQVWSERKIKPKEVYHLPRKQVKELQNSLGKELVKYLAEECNLGGEFAEEVCFRSSIEKDRTEISDVEKKVIEDNIDAIRDHENNKGGFIYKIKGKKHIYPIRMGSLHYDGDIEIFDDFNSAVDDVFSKELKKMIKDSMSEKENKVVKKYQRIIDNQNMQLEKNNKIIEECSAKGDLIYQNYHEIDTILKELRKARETMSWKEIKEKISNPRIKKINEKAGKIILDL